LSDFYLTPYRRVRCGLLAGGVPSLATDMLLCPRCTSALTSEAEASGVAFRCATCRGQAVPQAVLRSALDAGTVSGIWMRAHAGTRRGDRPCPSCAAPMAEVGLARGGSEVTIDACERCRMVWFDARERETLGPRAAGGEPVPAAPTAPAAPMAPEPPRAHVPARGTRVLRGRTPPDEGEVVDFDPFEPEWWRGMLGWPAKHGAPESPRAPWATTLLAATIVALTAYGLARGLAEGGLGGAHDLLSSWAREWGFVPADPWRHGGLTVVTSFFLHGHALHALGNAYFLLLAGGDLEGLIGRARWALLLLASTASGDLLESLLDPGSPVPRVGASAGIAGLFAYYALALPRVRLGLMFTSWGWHTGRGPRFHQVRLTVPWVFGVWLALEVVWSLAGRHGVAHGAHVGGALAGLAWWAVEGRIRGARKVEAGSVR
jgi:membrane associated rhomboid family serine protease/Zn-finger nucleic acid-binding protein